MAKHQAIRPGLVNDFRAMKVMAEAKEAQKKGLDPEDQHLYILSESPGWEILSKYIINLKEEVDGLLTAAIAAGLSREEIGDRALLVSLTKEALQKIINKVSDAAEYVREQGESKSEEE